MAKAVLIADDNPIMRKMLCEMFEREDDYDLCAEAANGREAINLAIQHRPHLIVLDYSMPVLNGLEAAGQLKKIMPTVPIILFTQHADLFNTSFGTGLPVDRIVSKDEANLLIGHIRTLTHA